MNHSSHLRRLATCAVFCLLSLSACAKDLSRDEARQLLRARRPYPEILRSYIKFPVGTSWQCEPKKWADQEFVKRAASEGLITFQITGRQKRDFACYGNYTAHEVVSALTEKGRALVVSTTARNQPDGADLVSFRACELDFGDITRIAPAENGSGAEVEYTERYVRVTPFADDHHNGKCVAGTTLSRRARFRRYDTGWRVVSD